MMGASGAHSPSPPSFDELVADLRLLRSRGLGCARQVALPALARAVNLSGNSSSATSADMQSGDIEALLRKVVPHLGGGREGQSAEYTFGLAQGTKLWTATDRRKAAAKAQGVSTDRFRKGYEPRIIEQLAEGILTELSNVGRRSISSAGRDSLQTLDMRRKLFSRSSLIQLGRRRTAYPLDLSLAELVRSNLFVATAISRYNRREKSKTFTTAQIASALSEGRSCLLLGEPGAGKSLTLYKIAVECANSGLTPVAVRAEDLPDLALFADLFENSEAGINVVLLIDGLDEAMTAWAASEGTPQLLPDIVSTLPCLITCRTREYEESATLNQADVVFDDIYSLQQWSVDTEFREYLGRLEDARLVDGDRLYDIVAGSRELSRLVTRPLYARMLTFVGENSARGLSNLPQLYGEYMSKLAHVADIALERRRCELPRGALGLWKILAWNSYVAKSVGQDAIRLDGIESTLLPTRSAECVRSGLDYILDRRTHNGIALGEFIHYSFYEYLLARRVCDGLLSRDIDIIELLRRDLSREVRHHLVGQLQLGGAAEATSRLAAVYDELQSRNKESSDHLTVANLIIYLLSRTSPDINRIMATLTTLLRRETSAFLRSAILWSLCHLGSAEAASQFFDELEADDELRITCRGYVLYYYGDMVHGDGPPFVDLPPYSTPVVRTRQQLLSLFRTPEFTTHVAVERTFIDIYTFVDVLKHRDVTISKADQQCLIDLTETMSSPHIKDRMSNRLRSMIQQLRTSEGEQ